MATFTNYATLTYNGGSINSNVVTGELLETLFMTKTAVSPQYGARDDVTYVISLINSAGTAFSGLTLTDDLGGYPFGGETVYPLVYREGSIRYYINGVLQPAPTVTAGPPLVIESISVPAGGNVILIYEADVTGYAAPGVDGQITNTVTAGGGGIGTPIVAEETVQARQQAELSVGKSVSPTVVTENGQLTYTFLIENAGSAPVVATDDVVLTDVFDPILDPISVTYNGSLWTEGVNYTYDPATGSFASLSGQITVPAATYSQGADGIWTVNPGTAVLVISGTV